MGLLSKEDELKVLGFLKEKGLELVDAALAFEASKLLGKAIPVSTIRRLRSKLGIIKKGLK